MSTQDDISRIADENYSSETDTRGSIRSPAIYSVKVHVVERLLWN